MLTIAIVVRDRKGNPTGGKIERSFDNAEKLAEWYEKQPGHNIEREQVESEKHSD